MDYPHRFSRLHIQEGDFPLQLPKELTDLFLEVVDSDGDVVALFCLVDTLKNSVFESLDALVHDYDELFFQHREDEDWKPSAKIETCVFSYPENQIDGQYQIFSKN